MYSNICLYIPNIPCNTSIVWLNSTKIISQPHSSWTISLGKLKMFARGTVCWHTKVFILYSPSQDISLLQYRVEPFTYSSFHGSAARDVAVENLASVRATSEYFQTCLTSIACGYCIFSYGNKVSNPNMLSTSTTIWKFQQCCFLQCNAISATPGLPIRYYSKHMVGHCRLQVRI